MLLYLYIFLGHAQGRLVSHVHVPQHYCYLISITITIINVVYYMFMYTSVENKYFWVLSRHINGRVWKV